MIKEAIEVGIKNLDHVIEEWCNENPQERNQKDHAYYYDYLKNKISYFLTPEALLGLREFFQKCEEQLPPEKEVPNSGIFSNDRYDGFVKSKMQGRKF